MKNKAKLIPLGAIVLALVALLILFLSNRMLGDCGWAVDAYAWIDANENGTWDEGEAPLPGVAITIDDTLNDYEAVAEGTTDDEGHVNLGVFLAGCPEAAFDIAAEPPEGYRFTTPASVQATSEETGATAHFGFAPEN